MDVMGNESKIFKRHLWYSVLDAVSAGILSNAPVMAIKGLGAADWYLTLPLVLSSLGMFIGLFSGIMMAERLKKPFVLIPGICYIACSLCMGLVDSAFWFLALYGIGSIFEVMTRPAMAAIIRANYDVDCRGFAIGRIRRWSSLVFLVAGMGSAYLLDCAENDRNMIPILVIIAGVFSIISYFVFGRMSINDPIDNVKCGVGGLLATVRRDHKFQHYLVGCLIFGFSGMLYVAVIPAFLSREFGYSYTTIALFVHIIPSICSFLSIVELGRWFDRVSLWKAWAAIRIGWGLDPLLLALAPLVPYPVFAILMARFSRGVVMGGSWILWWQIGINSIAVSSGDTSRYMGVLIFMNGIIRLIAPPLGALIIYHGSYEMLFIIGGLGVLVSAAYSYVCGVVIR